MQLAFNAFMFVLDRIRTVMLVLALIVLIKAVWIILGPL
jgi:hypothetical protein